MLAQGSMDYPARDIWRCLSTPAMSKEIDKYCDECFVIDRVGVNGSRVYHRSKRYLVASPRDYVLDSLTNQAGDGLIFIAFSSN